MQASGWRCSKCTHAEAECPILDRIQHTMVRLSRWAKTIQQRQHYPVCVLVLTQTVLLNRRVIRYLPFVWRIQSLVQSTGRSCSTTSARQRRNPRHTAQAPTLTKPPTATSDCTSNRPRSNSYIDESDLLSCYTVNARSMWCKCDVAAVTETWLCVISQMEFWQILRRADRLSHRHAHRCHQRNTSSQ